MQAPKRSAFHLMVTWKNEEEWEEVIHLVNKVKNLKAKNTGISYT